MAGRLSQDLGIPQISTGDIIRAAIRNETELGKKVKALVESGKLVPDEMTIALVKERLAQADAQKGYILDGFPRTIPQADALSTMTPIDCVVNFELKITEIIKRLSGRRVHKSSGRTYHILFTPPKVPGKDDITGEDLIQRPDDQEDAIRTRLKVYEEQTAPLIDYYQSRKMLITLDASPEANEVYRSLKKILPS
jgi:adenylate kinase